MKVHELGELDALPHCQPLKSFKWWNADIESVSPVQLTVARYQVQREYGHDAAEACFDTLEAEIRKLDMLTGLSVAHLTVKDPRPMLLSDLLEILSRFELDERQAIALALTLRLPLKEVLSLSRFEARQLALSNQFVHDLVESVTPALHSPLLFARYQRPAYAQPLDCLEGRFALRAGMSWVAFRAQCRFGIQLDVVKSDDLDEAAAALLNAI